MAALLEKVVYGVSLVKHDPDACIQALFLEDHGALFLIPVSWGLTDIGSGQTQAHMSTADVEDSLWEQTRREILTASRGDDVVERLGRQKTLEFKQQLMETLSHAAHIRHLTRDQWITLFVWSRDSSRRLVLRAQKQMIDQYARGDMASDAFAGHVTSWMY